MLNIKDLLLAPQLDDSQAAALLEPYGFKDLARADANLQTMAGDPSERHMLAYILEEVLTCIAQSADPDRALTYLERFTQAALNRTRLYSYLRDSPKVIEILAATMGGSPYMAEILIRDPHHFYWVTDPQVLRRRRKKREIERDLVRTLKAGLDEKKQLEYIRAVKRREILQIGVRDLLRISSVQETVDSLSELAEALITAVYWVCAKALRREYGIPRDAFTRFAVLGMGKLGGGELNFSSDVDLIYIYASDLEETAGMPASDYFRRLGRKMTFAMNEFTGEGYIYRVDLRLRPEGKAGDIACSLDSCEHYYNSRIGTWERLALLKAAPVAGNRALAGAFLEMARKVIFTPPFDAAALEDVRDIKRRIDEQMGLRQQRRRNVKLGTGGIREIELIAQTLQVQYGAEMRQIHERGTLKTLAVLSDNSLLHPEIRDTLTRAYIFLRDVENKLQIVNDAQTHSLPEDPDDLTACARRLGYTDSEEFLRDYREHTAAVHRLFMEVVGAPGESSALRPHDRQDLREHDG